MGIRVLYVLLVAGMFQQGLSAQSNAKEFLDIRRQLFSFKTGPEHLLTFGGDLCYVWNEEEKEEKLVKLNHDNVAFTNLHCSPFILGDKIYFPSNDYSARKTFFYVYNTDGELLEKRPEYDNPQGILFCKSQISPNAEYAVFSGEKNNLLTGTYVAVNTEAEIIWSTTKKEIEEATGEPNAVHQLLPYGIDNDGNGIFICKTLRDGVYIITVVRLNAGTKIMQVQNVEFEGGENKLDGLNFSIASDNRILLYANHYRPEPDQNYLHRVAFSIIDFETDNGSEAVMEITRTWEGKNGYDPGRLKGDWGEEGSLYFASEVYFPKAGAAQVILFLNKVDEKGNLLKEVQYTGISRTAFAAGKMDMLADRQGNVFISYIRIGDKRNDEKDNVLRCLILDGKNLEPIWETEPHQVSTMFIEMMRTSAIIWGDYLVLFHTPNKLRIISMKDGKEM